MVVDSWCFISIPSRPSSEAPVVRVAGDLHGNEGSRTARGVQGNARVSMNDHVGQTIPGHVRDVVTALADGRHRQPTLLFGNEAIAIGDEDGRARAIDADCVSKAVSRHFTE